MKNYSRLGPTHQLTIHSFKQLGISSEGSLDSIQFSLFIQQISYKQAIHKNQNTILHQQYNYMNIKAQKNIKKAKNFKEKKLFSPL